MSTICQNVATLTTTTVRTTSTIYVVTSTQQIAGRPTTSTIIVPSSTCSTVAPSSVACVTSASTRVTVITPAPTQAQVVVTLTSQIIETQLNTLFGTSCRTISPGQPAPALTDTTFTTSYVTVTGPAPPTTTTPSSTTTTDLSRPSISKSTIFGDPTSESTPSDTAAGAVSGESNSSSVPVGAIAGGVLGGLVVAALIGFLVYYFLFRKSISSKGTYKAPGASYSPYHENEESLYTSEHDTHYPGYAAQGGQQNQSLASRDLPSGQTQFQGSYPTQYTDAGGQGANHTQMYDPYGVQYPSAEMGQVASFNPAAAGVVALPVVAATSMRQSPHPTASSASPPPLDSGAGQYTRDSYHSTTPLVNHGLPHQHAISYQATNMVPYRGYAEPGA